ncbi:35227_t:CDS:2, partial [Racocetra persica]
PFIDILSTIINIKNADVETKKDRKQLKKINLTSEEWLFIEEVMPVLGLFTETIKKLKGSQYLTISYVYPAIQKIKSRLSCSFDPIDENNDSQDELKDAFDDLQFEDEEEDDKPKAKQRIKINNLVNTIGLINAIKGKLYHAINVYYEDLELDGLVVSLLDSC